MFENYSTIRLLSDKYISEGAKCGDIGVIIEVYNNGYYEIAFSDDSGIDYAQIVAEENEIELVKPAPAPVFIEDRNKNKNRVLLIAAIGIVILGVILPPVFFKADKEHRKRVYEAKLAIRSQDHGRLEQLINEDTSLANSPVSTGEPLLVIAITDGGVEDVEILLRHGAEVNHIHDGQSPLDMAIIKGKPDIVLVLQGHGGRPNRVNYNSP